MIEKYGQDFEEQVHSFNRKNEAIRKLSIGSYDCGVRAWQLYTKFNAYWKHRAVEK
jgi:hypothetical protein